MELLVGLGVLVLIVLVLGAMGSPSPSTPPARRPASTPPRPTAPPVRRAQPAAPSRNDDDRERLADEAFADGVIFSHYFLHDRHDQQSSMHDDDPWADDDDAFDDGYYD